MIMIIMIKIVIIMIIKETIGISIASTTNPAKKKPINRSATQIIGLVTIKKTINFKWTKSLFRKMFWQDFTRKILFNFV